ncbi:efflux RND transporter periplasmic adaptor subunit [Oxalicibacterium solurbis]|uniref:Efflux RND transporter periplasmic adaptor subunit n=1 Tax=Oxalicibacterium solurbis TaxID=69280 RepID=A0A8J3ATG5_9BURK|nr:efflux RND transporter periplasmic adaptor subunit [Oxalicibacterium solurbis]GGI52880.1 hypothetical protein GCM10011430_00540 [Oxalicibacterium solurbis]
MMTKPNKKQTYAILAILCAGILLGLLILLGGNHASGDADEHGHAENQTHAEGQESKAATAAFDDTRIKAAGIALAEAGPATIRTTVTLPGEIGFNQDRTAHVVPRLAGVVQSVPANLGQSVKKGEVLAVLASTQLSEQRSELLAVRQRLSLARNIYQREKQLWEEKISAEQDYLQARANLQEAEIAVQNAQQKLAALGADGSTAGAYNRYELRAPFDGTVVEKHLAPGEAVAADANVFTVSDLATVWAEVAVPASELHIVRVGETVTVRATAFDSSAQGKVAYVGALLGQQTRTAQARVTLQNPDGNWRPGLYVNVEIATQETQVPVAVAADAIQEVDGRRVVFVRTADGFIPQVVKTGRDDGNHVEIVEGLQTGARYAAEGSFIVKSELGKAQAEHSH